MKTNWIIWLVVAIIVILGVAYFAWGGSSASTTNSPANALQGLRNSKAVVPVLSVTPNVVVSGKNVTVSGSVNPNGEATSYWFEYGTSNAFDMVTPTSVTNAGAQPVAINSTLVGLKPHTPYSFRLGAKNSSGTFYSGVLNFISPQ